MTVPQHHRAFLVSAAWTLVLLFLGSVVHATGSSLACPDWPTCYGTMLPNMEGGVFWEHLHRLVAGGLILMWMLAWWLAHRERAPERIQKGCALGLALLLVQAVFGGVTVLLRLPPVVSTTHLALALVFLALAVALAVESSPHAPTAQPLPPALGDTLRRWGHMAAATVMVQSLLGGLVRHMDAGMACPDVPLCLGRVVPPFVHPLVALHYTHRVLAVVTGVVVLAAVAAILRAGARGAVAGLALAAGVLVVAQIALGIWSVAGRLAVAPVSLHTLVAALLFGASVALARFGRQLSPGAVGAHAALGAAPA
jgi:heme A synthase